eukprot:CAMPEP_0174726588 /NCGR_PEP_ID=MMETSP1094-20130205/48091_1 /TAXON_ID=156173 /ORGANISM="Chrysochromulina brevifilum, Strain UTEX LB 985" /LENGTH=30 /DNA_ID= /DNA_START= /DNA_END= /DNA_ORIENTATION=
MPSASADEETRALFTAILAPLMTLAVTVEI